MESRDISTPVAITPDTQEVPDVTASEIIESFFTGEFDGDKARYLGYRASGFSIRQAMSLVGRKARTVELWRRVDSKFSFYESQLGKVRSSLSKEFAHMEFLRNFRLVMLKDYNVFQKSIDRPKDLTPQEQKYLLKARSGYTPQQLESIERLISGSSDVSELDLTRLIISLSRTTETAELRLERGEQYGRETPDNGDFRDLEE